MSGVKSVTTIKIHQNHNVYILGAGFSRDAGYPLMYDFLDRMRDCLDSLPPSDEHPDRRAIEQVFAFRRQAAGAAYRMKLEAENIEQLFSLASAQSRKVAVDDIIRAIAATLRYAESTRRDARFNLFTLDPNLHRGCMAQTGWRPDQNDANNTFQVPAYQIFAALLNGEYCDPESNGRNTVISFNYDVILEKALEELGFTYSYPGAIITSGNERDLPILKLHGSINWGQVPASQGGSSSIAVSPDNPLELPPHTDVPILTPPTWNKSGSARLATWDCAVRAIEEATRIIIIGFSMAPTDIHFKYLMMAGLQDNISLRSFDVITRARGEELQNLKSNFNVFQPEFNAKIRWHERGIAGFVVSDQSLASIGRSLDSRRFRKITLGDYLTND